MPLAQAPVVQLWLLLGQAWHAAPASWRTMTLGAHSIRARPLAPHAGQAAGAVSEERRKNTSVTWPQAVQR
jgi:hypothetical protein